MTKHLNDTDLADVRRLERFANTAKVGSDQIADRWASEDLKTGLTCRGGSGKSALDMAQGR